MDNNNTKINLISLLLTIVIAVMIGVTINILAKEDSKNQNEVNNDEVIELEINQDLNEKYIEYNSMETTDGERTEIIKYIQLSYPNLIEEDITNEDVRVFYIEIMRCGDGVPRPEVKEFN